MATKIHIVRQHKLGKDKAFQIALKVAERMKEKAQIKYQVQGDVIAVERGGVSGHFKVSDNEVEVYVELGLMMRPMKGLIETKVGEYFDRYFASPQ